MKYADSLSYFSSGFERRLEDPAELGRQLFEHRNEADYVVEAIVELGRVAQNRKRYRKAGGSAARTKAGETIFELITLLAGDSGRVSYGELMVAVRRRHKRAGSRNGRVFRQLEDAGAIVVEHEYGSSDPGALVFVKLGRGIDAEPVIDYAAERDCPGHPSDERHAMGETWYCDGTCQS